MFSKPFFRVVAVLLAFSSIVFIVKCSSETDPHHEVHWSYEGDTGPDHWGDLDPDYWLASHGKNQSPINIVTSDVINSNLPNIQFSYVATTLEVVNNGHTIQANPATTSSIQIDGEQFNLLQFHFHALSEHTVDGVHYPMEAHFVHQSTSGELAVVGVMIEDGAENANYAPFWAHLPVEEEEVYDLTSQIDPITLLPADKRYYNYSGSLTTPPCTEGVNWYVIKEPVEMSTAQIAAFEAIYDHNYRPVQAVNARVVLYDSSL